MCVKICMIEKIKIDKIEKLLHNVFVNGGKNLLFRIRVERTLGFHDQGSSLGNYARRGWFRKY